jgi:hypothetical protein
VIWPGTPSFPIVLPPEPPTEGETPPNYILIWAPGLGWVWYPGEPPAPEQLPSTKPPGSSTTPKPPTATPKV